MKIKVGDWVKYKSTGEIARVRVVDNDKYINGVSIDDCIKLPIKFKGFEVVLDYAGNWVCYRHTKILGKIHVVCIKKGSQYFTGFHVSHGRMVSRYFPTIDQARDWLELQYATLIAKARGLV